MHKNIAFVFIILISACSPVKKIFESGSVQQTSFIEKIPFTFNFGIPFIHVNINGKNYNFMFDTGAPTVVSPELALSLNLSSKTSQTVSDSQGLSNKEGYVIIPSIKIGSLNFENIGAVVIEPSTVFEFKCMKYDGVIGANLMAKAIWKIDYQNEELVITNDVKKLEIPTEAKTIPFVAKKWQKTPLVPVTIDNKSYYTTFDTGFNGDFDLSLNTYANEVANFKSAQSIGANSLGIYGSGTNAFTTHVKIPRLEIGQVLLENQIFDFRHKSSHLLGNNFFKHYKVILNWKENKIYMIKATEYKVNKLETYGFAIKYIHNKPHVSTVYKNSEAEKLGLQINDQLLRLNEKDLTNLSDEETCFYFFNSILQTNESQIDIVVQRAGENIKLKLSKNIILD